MTGQTIGEKNKELWLELDRRATEIADLKRQLAEARREADEALIAAKEWEDANEEGCGRESDLMEKIAALQLDCLDQRTARVNAKAREERLREALTKANNRGQPYSKLTQDEIDEALLASLRAALDG